MEGEEHKKENEEEAEGLREPQAQEPPNRLVNSGRPWRFSRNTQWAAKFCRITAEAKVSQKGLQVG